MIERRTRAGTIGLYDFAPAGQEACAVHPHDDAIGPADPRPVGLVSTVVGGEADGVKLETTICADCLAEALAILFGRRHVQAGGDIEDLSTS